MTTNVNLVAWIDAGVTILRESGLTDEGMHSALRCLYYDLAYEILPQMLFKSVDSTTSEFKRLPVDKSDG